MALTTGEIVLVAGIANNLTYDDILSVLLQTLVFAANLAGGVIVGVATVRCFLVYVRDLVASDGREFPKEGIRLSLGRSLALALEFQLGADILSTALNPSLRNIEILGAIALLRTVLNFFLQRELADAQRREEAGQGPGQFLAPGPLPASKTSDSEPESTVRHFPSH